MTRTVNLDADDVRALENALWSYYEAFEGEAEGDNAMATYRMLSGEGALLVVLTDEQLDLMDRALTRWVEKFNPAERAETVARLHATLGKIRAHREQPL